MYSEYEAFISHSSWTHPIHCVDLYSWVGEEEGYDGCVAFHSRQMQRGIATLQRQRSRRRGEGCKEIQQGGDGVREHRRRRGVFAGDS